MKHLLLLLAAALPLSPLAAPTRADELAKNFATPPDSARPQTWWHWVDGNVTREGITADLEAMARVGIGGAQIFEAGCGVPSGPVKYVSPEWRELVKHAAQEASRLGLELTLHNCAGWSSSGGPWITPELSMQKLVWSETFLEGPKQIETALPPPPAEAGFYRDIAVFAFPTPEGENFSMAEAAPKLSASPGIVADKLPALTDGDPKTSIVVAGPALKLPQWVQLEFPQKYLARSLALTFVNSQHIEYHKFSGEIQVSDDGQKFRTIRTFAGNPPELTVVLNAVESRWFRIVFTSYTPPAWAQTAQLPLASLALLPVCRIEGVQAKAAFTRSEDRAADNFAPLPDAVVTHRSQMVEISSKMDGAGKLRWDVPAGKWTVLRFGHTTTGVKNHPATASGTGFECDKLSQAAMDAHFNGMLAKVIADVGPLAGKTFNNVLIDSWEVGSQNWTPKFREEFQQRRGYDPLPLLPAVTGRVVDGNEVTERFLCDFRQTIAELLAENYAGHLHDLAHQHGLRLTIEAYGNGLFNDLTYAGRADDTMNEFWSFNFGDGKKGFGNGSWNAMATAAHVYGRKITAAEAFSGTSAEKWLGHPGYIKDLGDSYFCEGINRFVFHRFAMQPWTNPARAPGMSMGPWGLHYERTQTWWEQSKAWHQYLARCQYLLQQGLFVADILSLQPEGALGVSPLANIRDGYRFDVCPAEVVLTRMSVKDGRIMLPDGMSYRMLVLPDVKTMTPPLLRRLKELVAAGATVIGPRPEKSPSLTGFPQCDAEVKQLASELWGDCDGKTNKEHAFGQGRAIWGRTPMEVLEAAGVKPDFSAVPEGLRFIHRRIGDADVYFVANRSQRAVESLCSFRITGKRPELWQPETGVMEKAAAYEEKDGITRVPLRFDPSGSVFVVFRKPSAGQPHSTTGKNWLEFQPVQEIAGAWEVNFDPKWGGPATPVTFEKLEDWSKRPEEGIRYYSGTAVYRKTFALSDSTLKKEKQKLFLDLGQVAVMAEVKLNGKNLGTLWKGGRQHVGIESGQPMVQPHDRRRATARGQQPQLRRDDQILAAVADRRQAQPDRSLHIHEPASVEEGRCACRVRSARPGDCAISGNGRSEITGHCSEIFNA
ncbi:MAG: glycosyl hydrolase [Verrucomicrobia bacterium]|nr:glycosyl hydrolase [Verrucomicrobiota bacterium]